MFKETKMKPTGDLETIIGAGVNLEGNFTGEGNIIIRGRIKGSIETKSDVKIEEGAVVEADIKGKNVIVAGEIKGNIKAEERISLSSSAHLLGNIDCKFLSVEDGAVFNGECRMGEKKTSEE
ncbi:MAG: polymer-forming cytoskeletal protein [Patescibacteria group bacterium]